MPNTFGDMQARILFEIGNPSGYAEAIKLAIKSAIKHYQDKAYWFLEARSFTTTIAGQGDYALPTDFQEAEKARVLVGNTNYPITARTYQFLEDRRITNTMTGIPCDLATYGATLLLYPVPSSAWPLTLSYIRIFPELSADGDTNAWLYEGEELIRARAKWDLYVNVMTDMEGATTASAAMTDAESNLDGQHASRVSSGRTTPTQF